jgi:hypothetical protein
VEAIRTKGARTNGVARLTTEEIMMRSTRRHEHGIRAGMRTVASTVTTSVSGILTMIRDPRAHRYQRYAAHHARHALVRAGHVGPRRAMNDRRIRADITLARRFAGASAHPHRHSTRNRIIAAGVVAGAAAGGLALGASRRGEPLSTPSPEQPGATEGEE